MRRLLVALPAVQLVAGCFLGHDPGGEDHRDAAFATPDAGAVAPADATVLPREDAGPVVEGWYRPQADPVPPPTGRSLTLRVTSVLPDPEGDYAPPYSASPTAGGEVRLDLLESETGTPDVRMTAPWLEPSMMWWTEGDILQRFVPQVGCPCAHAWLSGVAGGLDVRTLVENVNVEGYVADGVLMHTGRGTFEGTEEYRLGAEWGGSGRVMGDLEVEPDRIAPSARFTVATSPVLLPWDRIELELSEPVAVAEVASALRASAPSRLAPQRMDLGMTWGVALEPEGWWPDGTLHAVLEEGWVDLEGNAGGSASAARARVAEPAPVAALDFETPEGSAVTTWGRAVAVPSSIRCAAGDGCLALARRRGEPAGLYLRLRPGSPLDHVELRVRIVARDPVAGLEHLQTMIHQQAAAPGERPGGGLGTNILSPRTTGSEWAYDSGWQPLQVVPYPRPLDEAGVALWIDSVWEHDDGTIAEDAPPDAEVIVLVDEVRPR